MLEIKNIETSETFYITNNEGTVMKNVFSFDGYSEFEQWCIDNNYDPENMHDQTEESYKSNVILRFYVKNSSNNTYAQISVATNYYNGWEYGDVEREGLTRKIEQVVVEKITYE